MPKPKFKQWLEEVAGLMHEDPAYMYNDSTYSYEYLYNTYPKDRDDIIKDLRENDRAHFRDVAKTAYHPTFSKESDFSGRISKFNPLGIEGGRWDVAQRNNKWGRYVLSDSQLKHGWNVDKTIDYVTYAEPYEIEITDSKGRYPSKNGIIFGGVLPEVTITPTKKKTNVKSK